MKNWRSDSLHRRTGFRKSSLENFRSESLTGTGCQEVFINDMITRFFKLSFYGVVPRESAMPHRRAEGPFSPLRPNKEQRDYGGLHRRTDAEEV